MKHTVLILLLFISLVSCRTKQWDLNQSIKWKPDVQLSVLYARWSGTRSDTTLMQSKRSLDSSILEALERDRLGQIVENDSIAETDLHFLVAKEYHKAVEAIVEVARMHALEKRIEVVKREYTSDDRWKDSIVYPLAK